MQLLFTPKTVKVNVKEWGAETEVYVKEPTAAEFALFEHYQTLINFRSTPKKEREEAYARIALLFAVDANGKRLFDDEQLPQLMKTSNKPIRRIALAVMQLCELDAVEAETLEKN